MAEHLATERQSESEAAKADRAPVHSGQASEKSLNGAIILQPDANGVVVLPAGVGLHDIEVHGRDLVIKAHGQAYVIPDGAVFVPEIVVDGTPIPPPQFAALLIGLEHGNAAGPVPSSGGNFAEPVGHIQPAFALGDLLPYTELNFPEPREREFIPDVPSRMPDVVIDTGTGVPASSDAVDQVMEAGLPALRGTGALESPGSRAGDGSAATDGSIIITAEDGIRSITINGVVVTGAAGQQIVTPNGVLTLGALTGGIIAYT